MRWSLLAATMLTSACAMNVPPPAPLPPAAAADVIEAAPATLPALAYPQTRRTNVTETQFGTAVADPYR